MLLLRRRISRNSLINSLKERYTKQILFQAYRFALKTKKYSIIQNNETSESQQFECLPTLEFRVL